MPAASGYPFVPKSTAKLRPGQFWAIPLSDGRFACGRVLDLLASGESGSRTYFVAGLLDWVGTDPPTSERIAGAPVLEHGQAHIRSIVASGSEILGWRSLDLDGLAGPRHVRSYYADRSLRGRAEHVFVKGSPPPAFEVRSVFSPLTDEMLRPFTTPAGVVQFQGLLTEIDFRRLGRLLSQNPRVGLRSFGYSVESLEWLRHIPTTLTSLSIGPTKRRLGLDILARFTRLRSLAIEGQTKNIGVVGRLVALEELMLRSVTLPDLSILLPLTALRSLQLKLGGTRDLGLLPRIGRLEHLELWMIKGLDDLGPVGHLPHLRYLFLQALRRVERLPDFGGTPVLKRLHLETMNGLRELSPITGAARLEELLLVNMHHLVPEDLGCLVGHQSLRAVSLGLGSRKKEETAEKLLGLPPVEGFKVPWRSL